MQNFRFVPLLVPQTRDGNRIEDILRYLLRNVSAMR